MYYSLNPSLSSLRFNIYSGKRNIKINNWAYKYWRSHRVKEVTQKSWNIDFIYPLLLSLFWKILYSLDSFFDFSVLQTYKSLEMYSYFLKKKRIYERFKYPRNLSL